MYVSGPLLIYWAIPEKKNKQEGQAGVGVGLRIWNFQGYQRNRM